MDLFKDFENVSTKQWKQKIQFELNGADYNKTLLWESAEGIKVKPFYNQEDTKDKLETHFPALGWKIVQPIFVFDVEKSIKRALNILKNGAESLYFTIPNEKINITSLLESLPLKKISIYFNFNFLSENFLQKIETVQKTKNAIFFYNLDPISQLAQQGNWFFNNEKNNFKILENIDNKTNTFSLISIDGTLYQNAGANMAQQIAYCLAQANEYFNSVPQIKSTFTFKIALGNNFFFEIAKVRALRLLFKILAKEYNHFLDCHIIAFCSKRNKTLYSNSYNLLRSNTEYLSAILGGANAIVPFLFDSLSEKENAFSNQLAQQQLLDLKNNFTKVKNPIDGSYYIESLTTQLADKALKLFLNIEEQGGFLKQLKIGTIQKKIQESANKEQNDFDIKNIKLYGSNCFTNTSEKMKGKISLFPFAKIKNQKKIILPIIEKRLSENDERNRLLKEI